MYNSLKILVLSDSHGVLEFMRRCVEAVRPDVVLHLGDMVRDGETLAGEYPDIRFFQVAGNCDSGRVPMDYPEALVESFLGNRVYMTHGHLHGVKIFLSKLLADGSQCGANIILYGHTHRADCFMDGDCLVMNPGAAGYGGSAGIIELRGKGDFTGRIIRQWDLEGFE